MCQEVYLLNDQCNVHPDNVELFVNFDEVISKNLNVMDMTAFTLCRENNLPIMVFNVNTPGNLLRLLKGEKIGTIVS